MVRTSKRSLLNRRLGIVMDPIEAIHPEKDTSLALLLEATRRKYRLYYIRPGAITATGEGPSACLPILRVFDSTTSWFDLGKEETIPLSRLDVILMRKDPPFDQEYVYLTYLLELAEQAGTRIINAPRSLRDYNEKASILRFPDLAPPTLIARETGPIRAFLAREGKIVLKPLGGMGGQGVFVIDSDNPNLNVIVESLTHEGREHVMAQRYLPEITHGDMRVLVINGKPVPYMLARIPKAGESRGNLAAGGHGEPRPLGRRERRVAETIAPILARDGLIFVGLDIIGGKLTEINVTSPTCVRELDRAYGINIAADLFDALEDNPEGKPAAVQ